ncbi:MAG: ABC transporter substrate-binding protein [Candidatus Aenigmarchaeota archaeon]|nr:ABC transporter substrate-binding protein [Candidatus Aenigmarchaeota archaeon]MDI6722381.1 ABC transporter substrate-binding protein [Candidatus Aenigmarchaeota archaeon]
MKKHLKEVNNPIKLIEGGLLRYKEKMTSVELQHEAPRLWIKDSFGMDKQIIGPVTMESPELIAQAGSSAEGIIYSAFKFDINDPSVMAFQEKYKARYNKTLGFRTAVSYDATIIIASLLKKCGEDVECVKKGLYETKDYSGMSGLTSFDENGDVIKPLVIKTVRNGEFVEYEG